MRVQLLAPARAEFEAAVADYDSQEPGLGSRFAAEVKRTIGRILQYPEAWPPLSKRTRRCRTRKSPYGIIYQVRGEELLVVAVMHLHRAPETWQGRVREGND